MIGILSTSIGNTASVANALDRLGQKYFLSADPAKLQKADKLILPGVGAARAGMQALKKTGLDQFLRETKKPVLGICLGMQLLAEHSEEGNVGCLGIIPGAVRRFQTNLPVPHVGWNRLTINDLRFTKNAKLSLLNNIPTQSYFYFIHSYYLPVDKYTLASCNYDTEFSVIVQKNNFIGVQFHPEKSGPVGQALLQNFCDLPLV